MFVDDVDWSDLNSLRDYRLGRMTQFGANMDFRFKGKFKSSGEGGDESNEALEEQDSDGLAIDPMAGDLAIIFPIIEMAGWHVIFGNELMYVVNQENEINDNKVNRSLQLKYDKIIRKSQHYKSLISIFKNIEESTESIVK